MTAPLIQLTPDWIAKLRMTARRAGRLESLLLEIANRAEAGEDSARLVQEVDDLLFAIVVALPAKQARTAPPSLQCVECRKADAELDEEEVSAAAPQRPFPF